MKKCTRELNGDLYGLPQSVAPFMEAPRPETHELALAILDYIGSNYLNKLRNKACNLYKHDPNDLIPVVLTTKRGAPRFDRTLEDTPEHSRLAVSFGPRTGQWIESFHQACKADNLWHQMW